MKIIIVDKNEKLLNLLKMSIELIGGTEVIPRTNCSEALSMLKLLGEDVKLVVIYDPESESKREELISYTTKQMQSTYAIVVSDSLSIEDKKIRMIKRVDDSDELIKIVKETLTEELRSDHIRTYQSLDVSYLAYFDIAPVNIYFQVKGEGEEHKYIKLLHEGAEIDEAFLEKYKSKNLKYFFIKSSDGDKIHKILTRQIISLFKEGKKASPEVKISYGELHQQAYDQLTNIGFNAVTTKLAMETTENLLSSMKNTKSLQTSLKDIYKTGASLSYRLSYMTAMVAYNLVASFGWSNEENLKAVVFAALLNDLQLSEDHLKIRSDDDFKKLKLDSKQRELVKNHAATGAKILEKIKDLPPETYRIVMQHHGNLGGIGFSDTLSDQITLLSTCFIASEEFVYRILLSPTKQINIPDIIKAMREKFMGDSKSRIVTALKALEATLAS